MRTTVFRNLNGEIVGSVTPANGGEEMDISDPEYQEFINRPPPLPNPIDLAEQHIGKHFSTPRLLQMKVWWDTFPHEATPKLAATYGWTDTVTRAAIGGVTEFPDPPFTFAEIAQEIIQLGT
jgi:hypothetical protein